MESLSNYNVYFYFMIAAAIGLFLMMPGRGKGKLGKIGALVSGIVLVAFITKIFKGDQDGNTEFFFSLFSGIALFSAVMMITQKKTIYCALFFVLTIIAVALLLMLQSAEFLCVALIMIYGGAILVTYIFALTLSKQEKLEDYDTKARSPFLAIFVGGTLMMGMIHLLLTVGAGTNEIQAIPEGMDLALFGSAKELGRELFTKHMLAIQLSGVLLLVAAVGGIAIVKHMKIKL